MSKPILKRSEVAEKDTWNLGDIFASDELWRSEYENLKAAPESILKYRGRLGESAGLMLGYFRLCDEISVRLGKLYGYASCKGDEDTGNSFIKPSIT